jgi:hypothetical protein
MKHGYRVHGCLQHPNLGLCMNILVKITVATFIYTSCLFHRDYPQKTHKSYLEFF